MAERPKLESVAKEAGVSTATASQVMRGTGRISDKTRKKVLLAAKKLHYVPNARAVSLRSGENREIGFSVNQITNPFNAEVFSGASDLLEEKGYLVSVLDARDDSARQSRHIDAFIRNGRGGLLWVPSLLTQDSTCDLLEAHGIPTVTFLRRVAGCGFDHVGIRNAEATQAATAFLADLGHRGIAYLGGEEMSSVRRERISGYRQVMAARALGAPVVWDCSDDKLAGLNALLALRAAHPRVTAVVCNGDIVALGACLALTRMGQAPARDFSVIGFDDIQDAVMATPPLTTMAVSPYQLGERLAQMLLERIRNPDMPATVAEIPAKLVVRETTGAPA